MIYLTSLYKLPARMKSCVGQSTNERWCDEWRKAKVVVVRVPVLLTPQTNPQQLAISRVVEATIPQKAEEENHQKANKPIVLSLAYIICARENTTLPYLSATYSLNPTFNSSVSKKRRYVMFLYVD